ncbi:hypothetical protein OKW50_008342 [Paraburkholderia youngii]
MKTRLPPLPSPHAAEPPRFPAADELAVLRAWYAGLPVREAVERYQPASLGDGKSARGVLGRIRRRLQAIARTAHRDDLATLLDHPAEDRKIAHGTQKQSRTPSNC